MLQGHLKCSLNRTQIQLRYNRFKGGREDVNDDPRPRYVSTSTTNENIEVEKRKRKCFGIIVE